MNLKKYSPSDMSLFPTSISSSNVPNFELLQVGLLIGDTAFCSSFIARKCSSPSALLSHLEYIGSSDPDVALTLLRHCASFCKLTHLARGTPSSSAVEAWKVFDLLSVPPLMHFTSIHVSSTLHAVKWWLDLNPHSGNNDIPQTCPLYAQRACWIHCVTIVSPASVGGMCLTATICCAMQSVKPAARHPYQFAWKQVVV